jgi:hypothetical protein
MGGAPRAPLDQFEHGPEVRGVNDDGLEVGRVSQVEPQPPYGVGRQELLPAAPPGRQLVVGRRSLAPVCHFCLTALTAEIRPALARRQRKGTINANESPPGRFSARATPPARARRRSIPPKRLRGCGALMPTANISLMASTTPGPYYSPPLSDPLWDDFP